MDVQNIDLWDILIRSVLLVSTILFFELVRYFLEIFERFFKTFLIVFKHFVPFSPIGGFTAEQYSMYILKSALNQIPFHAIHLHTSSIQQLYIGIALYLVRRPWSSVWPKNILWDK